MRGTENEPSFLPYTVRFLAEQRKTTPESLALLTTTNAENLLTPSTL
jgi:Tat protein secretion system quality control protein TatD with DNase activity